MLRTETGVLRGDGTFDSDSSHETYEGALKYLRWKIAGGGARITGCDKSFEGAMVIPDRINGIAVVEICDDAFYQCSLLVSVVLPDSIETIGCGAFRGCVGLEEIHLGAGIKKIESQAFKGCSSLRRVVLPSTLEELSPDAFDDSVDLIVDDDSLSNDDDERL